MCSKAVGRDGKHSVANHLGSSRLEENLNDFFELHSEELRNHLRCQRRGSLGSAGARGEEDPEHGNIENANADDGEFSLRIHELYQEFLQVVQANLEEFLHAEGLTEAELRDACEKEMQVEDPGGLSFMHTLISSWEFSSFVELASDFVDEEIDAEESDDDNDEDEEEEEEEEEEEQREASDTQESPPFSSSGSRSPPYYRVGELGATAGGSTDIGGNHRGRCERCSGRSGGTGTSKDGDRHEMDAKERPHGDRRSSNRSSSRGSSRRSSRCSSRGSENNNSISSNRMCVTALSPTGAVAIDTVVGGGVGEGEHKAPPRDRRPRSPTAPSRDAENKSGMGGSSGGGGGGVGGTAVHSGAVHCCMENCAGLVAVESQPESDRIGAKARRLGERSRGVRQEEEEEEGQGLVEELSMRAEAKC